MTDSYCALMGHQEAGGSAGAHDRRPSSCSPAPGGLRGIHRKRTVTIVEEGDQQLRLRPAQARARICPDLHMHKLGFFAASWCWKQAHAGVRGMQGSRHNVRVLGALPCPPSHAHPLLPATTQVSWAPAPAWLPYAQRAVFCARRPQRLRAVRRAARARAAAPTQAA